MKMMYILIHTLLLCFKTTDLYTSDYKDLKKHFKTKTKNSKNKN